MGRPKVVFIISEVPSTYSPEYLWGQSAKQRRNTQVLRGHPGDGLAGPPGVEPGPRHPLRGARAIRRNVVSTVPEMFLRAITAKAMLSRGVEPHPPAFAGVHHYTISSVLSTFRPKARMTAFSPLSELVGEVTSSHQPANFFGAIGDKESRTHGTAGLAPDWFQQKK